MDMLPLIRTRNSSYQSVWQQPRRTFDSFVDGSHIGICLWGILGWRFIEEDAMHGISTGSSGTWNRHVIPAGICRDIREDQGDVSCCISSMDVADAAYIWIRV